MPDTMLYFPLVRLFNRVLSDDPLARDRLRAHAVKTVAAKVGPLAMVMRVSDRGEMEMVGEGGVRGENQVVPDISFQIPFVLLPRLVRGDENAFLEVVFTGDSELAATFSMVARNVEWDIEEDLSRLVGDIAAHRIVGTAKAFGSWTQDANTRLMANLAEYLTEERRSFITRRELEELAIANEALRDDLARLAARLNKLARPA